MKNRPAAEYVLLGLLMTDAMHGYEIVKALKDRLGEIWLVGTSQVYLLLQRLEKKRSGHLPARVRGEPPGQENLPDHTSWTKCVHGLGTGPDAPFKGFADRISDQTLFLGIPGAAGRPGSGSKTNPDT